MRNKLYILVALCLAFIFEICNAQVSLQKVTIVDAVTMEPIPYVRVSYGAKNGVYSDVNGQFYLSESLTDSVFISHVSYQDTTVLPCQIDSIICLTPVLFSLDEVVITNFTGSTIQFGTKEGKHHSGYAPFPFTINALYVPYDFSWDEAPQVKEIFLDLSYTNNSMATIQYYISTPDSITGDPNGHILSEQASFTFDNKSPRHKDRYYSMLDHPFIFPKCGLFIVFFVADPSYSYVEMLDVWGSKQFKLAKYMPISFYLTANQKEAYSWRLNVYSDSPFWKRCDSSDKEWNKMVAGMNVAKEGYIYNYMGGVIVQFPD